MNNEQKLKRNAQIGAGMMCFMGFMIFGFKSFLLETIGTGFSLVFILTFGIYGFYLMMPYFTNLSDSNKPWNKKF